MARQIKMVMKGTDLLERSAVELTLEKERSAPTEETVSKIGISSLEDPWNRLDLQILDHELSITGPGLNVNDRPYASLRCTLHLVWRKKGHTLELNDEVKAV